MFMEKKKIPTPPIGNAEKLSTTHQVSNEENCLLPTPHFGHPSCGGEGSAVNKEENAISLERNQNAHESTHSAGHSFEGGCERNNEHYDDGEESKQIDTPTSLNKVNITESAREGQLRENSDDSSKEVSFINHKETLQQDDKFPSAGGVSAGRGGQTPDELYAPHTECNSEAHGEQSPKGRDAPSVEGHIPRNTKKFMSLPYNPRLKQCARNLRKARNLPEVLFWLQVKNKQFKGYDFDRQKVIGNYIVDFYCGNCNVVVEIDGSSHDNKQEYDAIRDRYLQAQGLIVIHVPVIDVMKNMYEVMKMLHDHPALQYPLP